MIHHFKGFGKDHVVFPLFVPQEINGVYLCMFQYVENDRQTYGYFQAKAYVCQRFYSYTVEEKYLIQLDGVNVGILREQPEKWS